MTTATEYFTGEKCNTIPTYLNENALGLIEVLKSINIKIEILKTLENELEKSTVWFSLIWMHPNHFYKRY